MSAKEAVRLLRRQIKRLDQIVRLRYDDPAVGEFMSYTINLLNAVFGQPNGTLHPNTVQVKSSLRKVLWYDGITEAELQEGFENKLQTCKSLLKSFAEQLHDFAPPAAQVSQDQYRFHPEIERVSGDLYRNRHYKQAALEAYIRVIGEVKIRSRLNDDGESLMNHAFGCDKHAPVIQFNSLQTEAERDEQKGIMFLFKGTVGLRNFKAHSNKLFDDPYRAHDYLALASLLMRLLDIAAVNR